MYQALGFIIEVSARTAAHDAKFSMVWQEQARN
jgi:hypothetical protein